MNEKELFEKINAFLSMAMKHDAEGMIRGRAITLITPRELSKDSKIELVQSLPEGYEIVFSVGLRPSVKGLISEAIQQATPKEAVREAIRRATPSNPPIRFTENPNHLKVETTFEIEGLDMIWGYLCELMEKDGTYSSWTIGGRVYDSSAVKDIASHTRDKVLTKDDMTDVQIMLGKANTIEELLDMI